ncbi:MAG: glycine--tRNA ligase subunit beta, partial [Hyphomonadaceae bacterium]
MPQLLLELFSEEIPARMQKRAEEDLARLMLDKLSAAGFIPEATKTFSTPRRLAIIVEGLPAATPDISEEKKGPRVGAPEKAIEGFLRGAGLASIDQAKVQADPKGDFYVALIEKKGRDTKALAAEIVPEIIRAFPWPKSMRSGSSDFTWVRPLQNICCTFDGEEIAIALEGVPSKAETRGHRFLAGDAFMVRRYEDYAANLAKAKVVLDREERKAVILREAKTLCEARNLELVEDQGLLEEVAGLVEWPVPLMGEMDKAFLDLPGEVIRLSMRTHQKYFAVRDPKTKKLAPNFIVVSNIEATDAGKTIAAGNARVLSARLNDARFFWDADRKKPLDDETRIEKLKQIVFHQKLGSVWDKVERVKALAKELCAVTGADPKLVERAAHLCKCDLVTETVGEFPELQGQIGRQLYELQIREPSPLVGEGREGGRSEPSATAPSRERGASPTPNPSPQGGGEQSVAIAIEDHYRPLGPNDRVPTDPVAITLALADKLDMLSGFWAINEKPTGSSDAFGLRRAALGLIRTIRENGLRIDLERQIFLAADAHAQRIKNAPLVELRGAILAGGLTQAQETLANYAKHAESIAGVREFVALFMVTGGDASLLAFLADRLKVQLRDQGKRHDLVDAVFALGDDDLVRIVARVDALSAFLTTSDGANLLAAYKRAANILRAEEKKNAGLSTLLQSGEYPQERLFSEKEER